MNRNHLDRNAVSVNLNEPGTRMNINEMISIGNVYTINLIILFSAFLTV